MRCVRTKSCSNRRGTSRCRRASTACSATTPSDGRSRSTASDFGSRTRRMPVEWREWQPQSRSECQRRRRPPRNQIRWRRGSSVRCSTGRASAATSTRNRSRSLRATRRCRTPRSGTPLTFCAASIAATRWRKCSRSRRYGRTPASPGYRRRRTIKTSRDNVRTINECCDRASDTYRKLMLAMAEYRRPPRPAGVHVTPFTSRSNRSCRPSPKSRRTNKDERPVGDNPATPLPPLAGWAGLAAGVGASASTVAIVDRPTLARRQGDRPDERPVPRRAVGGRTAGDGGDSGRAGIATADHVAGCASL